VLSQFASVRIIVCLGTGYDGIDLAAAAASGVTVAHSPGANAASVADVAIALVIECVRDIPRLRRHIHAGQWNGLRGTRPEGRPGVTGRNLGIYGLGAIGSKIALRALACEMNVGYHGRRRRDDVTYPYFTSLRELAHWSSVLVVAARADATNRYVVNRDVLRALGADGYLVNIARGTLVDEAALIAALRDGTIAGAGLDVFENEPHVPAELLAFDNVVLTPHVGSATWQTRQAMADLAFGNLTAHFAGKPLLSPVP